MHPISAALAILLVFSAVYSSAADCVTASRTITHRIADCDTKLELGTQHYCKNEGHECTSRQGFGTRVDANSKSTREAIHCRIQTYTIVSGTKTKAQVLAATGCSIADNELGYKYVNATACNCEETEEYIVT